MLGVLKPLRIFAGWGNLSDLNARLNDKLQVAGLKSVPDGATFSAYDDLIRKLIRAGRNTFTAADIKEICEHEGLWVGPKGDGDTGVDIGIRSFTRRTGYMEDETERMLDLVQHFAGRTIRNNRLWNEKIVPEVMSFLQTVATPGREYRLHLDTHTSVAFVGGYFLDSKAGISVAPVQKTLSGEQVWKQETIRDAASLPSWSVCESKKNPNVPDLAVAVSITHDVTGDVAAYLSRANLEVRGLLNCTIRPGPGSTAIANGVHAVKLVQDLIAEIRQRRGTSAGTLHLYIAGPNAFTFILGQHARVLGKCVIYEYDFEAGALGAYQPAIALPSQIDQAPSDNAEEMK